MPRPHFNPLTLVLTVTLIFSTALSDPGQFQDDDFSNATNTQQSAGRPLRQAPTTRNNCSSSIQTYLCQLEAHLSQLQKEVAGKLTHLDSCHVPTSDKESEVTSVPGAPRKLNQSGTPLEHLNVAEADGGGMEIRELRPRESDLTAECIAAVLKGDKARAGLVWREIEFEKVVKQYHTAVIYSHLRYIISRVYNQNEENLERVLDFIRILSRGTQKSRGLETLVEQMEMANERSGVGAFLIGHFTASLFDDTAEARIWARLPPIVGSLSRQEKVKWYLKKGDDEWLRIKFADSTSSPIQILTAKQRPGSKALNASFLPPPLRRKVEEKASGSGAENHSGNQHPDNQQDYHQEREEDGDEGQDEVEWNFFGNPKDCYIRALGNSESGDDGIDKAPGFIKIDPVSQLLVREENHGSRFQIGLSRNQNSFHLLWNNKTINFMKRHGLPIAFTFQEGFPVAEFLVE